MARPITLRLSYMQCDWLYHELLGNVNDYTERGIMEPEEEAAMRQVIKDLETGICLAASKTELELKRLRSMTNS
jgi:hypothetical protein